MGLLHRNFQFIRDLSTWREKSEDRASASPRDSFFFSSPGLYGTRLVETSDTWRRRRGKFGENVESQAPVAASHDAAGPFGWLLSDKGPFHHSQEFAEFVERYQQGFTTKYKIYREFGRWKVNSLALEREDNGVALPLDPEFMQTIRQLGRRPTLGAITENIIRKYGTHFLLSATLGGEEALTIFVDKRRLSRTADLTDSNGTAVTLEALHQLAASYFIDRESTLRKLHHLQIASTAIKVIDVKYSQDQQSLIQPMDFYLTWMKTDVNTKALYTKLAILSVANICLRESGLLKWKSYFLGGG
ncbi:hypothetical protein QQF64_028590, partial [Cirrhinus molitorella]